MPDFTGATRGSTNERGYGWRDHMVPRKRAFAALPEWSPCVRCGKPMWKYATMTDRLGRKRSTLHYDHAEDGGYLGFSHMDCNLKAGASKGGQVTAATFYKRGMIRHCIQCGAAYRAWHPDQSKCSRACRNVGKPAAQPSTYQCEMCGRTGQQSSNSRPRKVCARPACLRQRRNAYAAAYKQRHPRFQSSAGQHGQAALWQ
jgi:hypothetical protein